MTFNFSLITGIGFAIAYFSPDEVHLVDHDCHLVSLTFLCFHCNILIPK